MIDLYGNLGVWTTAVIGLRDREEVYQFSDLVTSSNYQGVRALSSNATRNKLVTVRVEEVRVWNRNSNRTGFASSWRQPQDPGRPGGRGDRAVVDGPACSAWRLVVGSVAPLSWEIVVPLRSICVMSAAALRCRQVLAQALVSSSDSGVPARSAASIASGSKDGPNGSA